MKTKKILYVATTDSHIKAFHIPYLKMMHEKGWEVHVATNGNEKIPYCDKKHAISMSRSPFKINNAKAIRQMRKIVKEEKYDIIHCHTPIGSAIARLAAKQSRKHGTKVVYTAHGFHFYKGAPIVNWLIFYPIEKYLAKYTDALITINQDDYNLAKTKFSKRCKQITYTPGVGINTKKFAIIVSEEEKRKIKEELSLKSTDIVLLCIARLDKNKNQAFLIDVMDKIQNNDIHLLLAGPDELGGYYQKLAEQKEPINIHFLGERNDVPKLLSISDILVTASKREGLPINIVEALAAGKPVVSLGCRGTNDLIKNGVNGYIANNQSDFIDKINTILNDEKLRRKIKINDKKECKKYSIDKITQQVYNIYDELA